LGAGFGSHRTGVFVVHFRQDGTIIFGVGFGEQGRDLAQFLGGLL
jgi:hypothetical protein